MSKVSALDLVSSIGEAQHEIMDKEGSKLGSPRVKSDPRVKVHHCPRMESHELDVSLASGTTLIRCGSGVFHEMKEKQGENPSYSFEDNSQ